LAPGFFGKIVSMLKKILQTIMKLTWYLMLGGIGIVTISRLVTGLVGWTRTYSAEDVPKRGWPSFSGPD
jgi:hypothetical protein